MRILVTFAVEAEFAPWRKLRSFKQISTVPFQLFDASLGPHSVRVLLTGIGWECAWRTANPAMNDMFDACISSGFCGALKDEYQAGDVMAFSTVRELSGERSFASSPWLLRHINGGVKVADTLLTSRRLVLTAKEKRRIAAFGDAIDMESFRILAAAQGRGIPALALRVVSDTADEDLPLDFSQHVSESGQIATGRVLGSVIFSPQLIPAMLRFGARTHKAAVGLAHALDAFLEKLVPEQTANRSEVASR